MSWLEALPPYTLVAVLMVLPGALLSVALGLRGLARWASVVPLSVAGFSASAVVYGMLGVPWNPLTVTAAFAGVAVLLWLVMIPARRRVAAAPWAGTVPWRERITAPTVGIWCGAVLGVGIVVQRLYLILQVPDALSQTYDANFHYNAVRFIEDTGTASSLTIGGLGVTDPSFYPAAWHDSVAFVTDAGNLPVALSANAMTMLVCGGVWVLGCLYFTTRVLGSRPAVAVATGLMASSFPAFPYLLSFYGNLFPNAMSIACLPLWLGLLADALGLSRDPYLRSKLALWITILAVTGAMGLAHPSTVVLGLAILWIMLLTLWWRELRSPRAWWRKLLGAVALVAMLLVLQQIWFSARASWDSSSWKPHATQPQAVGEALATVYPGAPHAPWVLMVLVLLGAAALLRHTSRWLVGAWVLLMWLYVLVASSRNFPLRYDWTGVWYNDSNRLLALIPVMAVPLSVAGALAVLHWVVTHVRTFVLQLSQRSGTSPTVRRLAERSRPLLRTRTTAVVGGLAAVLVGWQVVQTEPMTDIVDYGKALYAGGGAHPYALLDPAEQELLEELPEYVPQGAVVFGNPLTGTSQAYAVSGIKVLFPHNGLVADREASVIAHHLDELTTDPEVCPALHKHNVQYVLDFGTRQVNPYAYFDTRGYDQLTPDRGFELVAQTGPEAKLYKITGCGD
ncbi:hypothetical protein RGB72_02655 [Glutamicibacter protophormiae]|uniref:DUF6541 family protein n=1 Tax=Kocuria salsicia TaxID=664639 RepID=UPI001E3DD391|nr:DUF6541 family protein [Kocuria salsicia]WNB89367.1 hypothetical protein RGB72_02655 [Glutamicibacter protophormiae]